MPVTTIGFDADDTLWHNERFFRWTTGRFVELLDGHADPDHISERLLDAERRNIRHYGFGIKGFTLSMIETAIEVGGSDLPSDVIGRILALGRDMLAHPVETLPHAAETLEALATSHRLVLITKGDLFDQERKLAQSGLGDFFREVEIVSDKSAKTYARIFARAGDGPEKSVMVGNSLKSDVVPAIEAGAWGIHVPHEHTWALEHADEPLDSPRYRRIDDLGGLVDLIEKIG